MAGHALHFHCARGIATRVLAHVSDSLVRVSRRVGGAPYVSRRRRVGAPQALPKPRQVDSPNAAAAADPPHQSAPSRLPKPPCGRQKAHTRLSRCGDTGHNRVSSCQFQALFDSLFKVLCIFPSRYLFAIGLSPVFSFRWNLPPTSSCNPKQPDSTRTHRAAILRHGTGFSPSPIPCSKGFGRREWPMAPF